MFTSSVPLRPSNPRAEFFDYHWMNHCIADIQVSCFVCRKPRGEIDFGQFNLLRASVRSHEAASNVERMFGGPIEIWRQTHNPYNAMLTVAACPDHDHLLVVLNLETRNGLITREAVHRAENGLLRRAQLEQMVRPRAYALWQKQPNSPALDNWLEAEQELLQKYKIDC